MALARAGDAGGRAGRKGAGRKVVVAVRFTPPEAVALDAAKGTETRLDAVRKLVLDGLGAIK